MENIESKKYDVVIIGGGVVGAALLYVLVRHTNISRIVLLEKYPKLAQVNSSSKNNSQTLHFGDIETNYSLPKAKAVKEATEMILRYIKEVGDPGGSIICGPAGKMVLGVGEKEVRLLTERYEIFKNLFPKLEKLGRDQIAKLEPKVVRGRNPLEKILALYSGEACTVDFGKLAESFVENAKRIGGERVQVFLNSKAGEIRKTENSYFIRAGMNFFQGTVVVVAAGNHSLLLAKSMGYGKEYSVLPTQGNFYYTPNVLGGKVYTVQVEKLPFAAVHGDPDLNVPEKTRFGPTARVIPWLEARNYRTTLDFMKSFGWNFNSIITVFKIMSDPVIFKFILRNFFFRWPLIGKRLYLKQIRKIIPSIKLKDVKLAKGIGGIRAQVIDTEKKQLLLGEVKIIGENIIFNMTPSPGATSSLKSAFDDARKVIEFFRGQYVFS
ncbi:MAG: FAD-dependent oxidoreductase [Candidatus Liptonbacteria bacterium]|nr:FAD-dependent oxidoreductase [Candidatus Liptonbacteria bacterium]